MLDIFFSYTDKITGAVFDPSKRMFVGYLATAIGLALLYLIFSRGLSFRQGLSTVFSKKVIWSPSSQADLKIFAINQAVMLGVAPRLISRLALATLLFEGLHPLIGGRPILLDQAPVWVIAFLYTVTLFLLDDATKYLLHRCLHRWPVLWAFHKVHHSAETLTPLTVFRTHPVEGILFALRSTLVQASVIAGFVFFFGGRVELLSILGANVFLFAFNALGANLRHSHIPIRYGRLIEHFLISPAQHQVHHSAAMRHFDRNFGAVLAIWDLIGGTLYVTRPKERIRFGLSNTIRPHSLQALYLTPVTDAWQAVRNSASKGSIMTKTITAFLTGRLTSRSTKHLAGAIGLSLAIVAAGIGHAMGGELNIYSHRQPFLIQPFIDAYQEETGTQVNIVFAKKGLAQRLQAEGERSPADVVLTVDIARLHVYADKDLLATVNSPILEKNIPAHLRDPGNRWFAFSKRARIIAVFKEAEGKEGLKRYEDLAGPDWKGRLCSRPGSHVYNRALLASMIHAHGEAETEAWAKGVVANLARRPQGNDRAQIKAIFEGQCDATVVNNYYIGKLANSEKAEQREWAAAVELIFPNQDDRGTHINISGGGVAKHSKNKEEAIRFLEFLTEQKAQELYGAVNFEYPVNPAVPTPGSLSFGGDFKEDTMPISTIADLAPLAQRIIDRAGW